MTDLNRGRRQGALFVLLLVSAGVAFAAWRAGQAPIELTDAERKAAVKAKFVPVQVVKKIETIVEVPKIIEKVVTERVEVSVPPETVPVQRVETPIPEECEQVDPLRDFTLGGGCEIALVAQGRDKMARATWWADAKGNGWEAHRGPLVADEVVYEQLASATPSPWAHRWWFGGMKAGGSYGPVVAYSIERRRWAAQVGLGVVFDVPSIGYIDQEIPTISGSTDVVGLVMVSRR